MSRPRGPRSLPVAATLSLAAALLVAQAALAREYMTPGFRTRATRPLVIAVLPPHAEFIKAKAVMTDQMVKEAEALEDESQKAIAAGLKAKGYEVREISVADLDATPGLKDLVTGLNNRYNEEWSKVLRTPKGVKKGRFTTGDAAAKVCTLLKVDGLVVTRVVAVGVTGGKAALTAILSLGHVYAQSYARMDLSVLHGRSGRFEGHFIGLKNTTLGGLIKKPAAVIGKLTEMTLDDFPGSSEVKRVSAKEAAAELTEDETPSADDEAAIGDFEAILEKHAGAAPSEAATPGTETPAAAPQPTPAPGGAAAEPAPSPSP